MTLRRNYKIGSKIRFKWYDHWRDEIENPNNFRVIEGYVQENTALNSVIVYDDKENNVYAIPCENIIK